MKADAKSGFKTVDQQLQPHDEVRKEKRGGPPRRADFYLQFHPLRAVLHATYIPILRNLP